MIFFDMGNVLLKFDFNRTAEAISTFTNKDGWEIIQRIYEEEMPMWLGLENGDVIAEDFFQRIISKFELNISLTQFQNAYNDIFTLKEDMLELIIQLKNKGYKLGILSNTCSSHWDYVQHKFPQLFSQFDILCASHELRASKPDLKIYQLAAQKAGEPCSEILFTDDLPQNVEGAKKAGFDAVVFINRDKLIEDLTACGYTL